MQFLCPPINPSGSINYERDARVICLEIFVFTGGEETHRGLLSEIMRPITDRQMMDWTAQQLLPVITMNLTIHQC